MWYMRLMGNGDADGVPTTLWQWRLQESGGVCHVCGGCGDGDAVCCDFGHDGNGQWLQEEVVFL